MAAVSDSQETSVVAQILTVEDFEPFRQYTCLKLKETPQLQVISEVSDGLEAVLKAEELQPDLILLDIGLPTLNGLEAARRIYKLSPKSKIIFLSQESSADVVQEAFRSGASGYVAKSRAEIDLLPAVRTVLESGHFVSGGLLGHNPNEITFRNDNCE